jgi:plastocyanin
MFACLNKEMMKSSRLPQLFGMLLLVVFAGYGCSNPEPSGTGGGSSNSTAPSGSVAGSVAGPVGTIRGVVHLVGKTPVPATDKINQDQSTCGDSVSLPRLVLGKTSGVKDTFVYLEDAPSVPGDQQPRPASLLMDQQKCQYTPHAMTVPVGTQLDIINSDSILHNVHGNTVATSGSQTLFNIAQPVKGSPSKTPALDKPGMIFLTCEAGHPWMNAFVFVADNPYVAVTKDDGDFVIPNVPAGTYHIKMWHEGVTLKSNDKKRQKYEYEDPYETTKEIVVTANGEAVVNFDLSLR